MQIPNSNLWSSANIAGLALVAFASYLAIGPHLAVISLAAFAGSAICFLAAIYGARAQNKLLKRQDRKIDELYSWLAEEKWKRGRGATMESATNQREITVPQQLAFDTIIASSRVPPPDSTKHETFARSMSFLVPPGDEEAAAYGLQLSALLTRHGWETEIVPVNDKPEYRRGLYYAYTSTAQPRGWNGRALTVKLEVFRCMKEVGIEGEDAPLGEPKGVGDYHAFIYIGRKPS